MGVSVPSAIARFFQHEDINFLVTNRIPRRYATLLVGWFSRIRSARLTRLSLAVWRVFGDDLALDEARTQDFESLRDCFVRELKPGARPIHADPSVVVSPCDAEIGAFGTVHHGAAIQAKGFSYSLGELLGDEAAARRYYDGKFVTLRLRANMYHRFHAPCDGHVRAVRYISGDTWNVNPIALKRVERLFCRNERAVVPIELAQPESSLTLVPIAAILVASIRLHCLPVALTLRYNGAETLACDAPVRKGEELGYFKNGSTIVVLASGDFEFAPQLAEGATIRMGQPLLTHHARLSLATHDRPSPDTGDSR